MPSRAERWLSECEAAQRNLTPQQLWRVQKARALRNINKAEFDPGLHPHDPATGRWAETGGGSGGSDGADKPTDGASNYGLVPGDVEKYHELRDQWGKLNNESFDYVDHPDAPVAQSIIKKMGEVNKQIHALHADPGTAAGIGYPGGPRDVAIVGAGPGGLLAAINGAADGLDTLVIEASATVGGQPKLSSRIENYGGFLLGVRGEKLAQTMYGQAQRLGAEAKLGVRVTGMSVNEDTGLKTLMLSNGEKIESRTVVIAGGVEFVPLPPFPGSEGPGVVVGASSEEIAKISNKGTVVVIGGSNGAAQAALGAIKEGCEHVYVLSRSPIAKAMSDYVVSGLRNNPKISIVENDTIAKLNRDENNNPVSMETKSGKTFLVDAVDGLIGSIPKTEWVPADIGRVKGGRLQTNPVTLETEIPGVYAVGDMRENAIGRITVAAGEGQLSIRQANVYLQGLKDAAKAESAAAKQSKPAKPKTPALSKAEFDATMDEIVAQDISEPWFGQTIDDVPAPVKPASSKKNFSDLIEKWDEAEHPRDDGGKFTDAGGGDGGSSNSAANERPVKHPGEGYSASAWVDNKGVIHTASVYDAQRALFENKKVELKQPKQVSTLIKRLGQTAKEMAKAGVKAPVFNLCNVSVSGTNLFCAVSKGIPRIKMPVIPAKQTEKFRKFLEKEGFEIDKGKEYAANLRSTQDQIDGAKVAANMKRVRKEGSYKRIFISKDDYILDGHHAWAAQLGVDAENNSLKDNKNVKVYRVNASITKLLAAAETFTGGKGKKPVGDKLMIPVSKVFARWSSLDDAAFDMDD